jgi:hypothetical protein
MEILDLVAKISWDTNTKDLQAVGAEMKKQDQLLDELRVKGGRLERQMLETNDPKKVKQYNDELQRTRKAADSIVEAQKKQVEATKKLTEEQKKLQEQLRKTNDPNAVKGLLQNLHKVDNQITAVTAKTQTMGNKLGGIGMSIIGGLGIGAGIGGAMALITDSFNTAIAEFENAEKQSRLLQGTLKSLGSEQYFEGLMLEATQLAEKFKYLDNDDIVSAQQQLLTYGKVTREEISSLLPIIIDFSARTGQDIPASTSLIIGALEGQGKALKQYGISMKDAETFTERLALVQDTLGEKVKGSAEDFANSTAGIKAAAEQQKADILESYGEAASKIELFFKTAVAGLFAFVNDMTKTNDDVIKAEFENIKKESEVWANDLSEKELNQQKRQNKLRETEIKESNKRIAELQKAREDEGFFISRKLDNEYEERIQNEKTRIEKNRQTILSVNNAIKTQEARLKKQTEERKRIELERVSDVENKPKSTSTKPKPKPEPEKKEKPVITVDLDIGKVTFTESPAELEKKAITSIENSPEFAYNEWFKKIQEDRKAEQKAKAEQDKQDVADAKMQIFDETMALADAAQQAIDIEKQKNDELIRLQEERVQATKGLSDKSLKIEEDRLQELLEKREKYERAQRVIDAAQIVANQALAVSNAIVAITSAAAKGGPAAPFLIAANVIAIAAGVFAATNAVRSIDPGFKDGGYTGEGDPNDVSTQLGNRGYKYHKKEFVMDEELTSKHRNLFEGLHKRDMVVKQLDDGNFYITRNGLDPDAILSDHNTINESTTSTALLYEMQSIRELLKQRELSVNNNFDAQGFGQAVAGQMNRITLKNKMRTW